MARKSAGALDRRITIRRAAITYNAFNEPVETFNDLVTVWANRNEVTAGEAYRAKEVGAELTTRFLIRYSSQVASVDPRDRIRFDGYEYNVTAVRNIDRNRWREIDAVRRAENT